MSVCNRRGALRALSLMATTVLVAGPATALAKSAGTPAEKAPVLAPDSKALWWKPTAMDAMTALRTRRSVRSYTDDPVSDADLHAILGAAMSAPSAGNEQPWEFIVVRERAQLAALAEANPFAKYVTKAPLAIITCANLKKCKFEGGYWQQDVAAATQNMLLAAHALQLGAVWTGVYPETKRVQSVQTLCHLPAHVKPLAMVVLGHPTKTVEPVDRFNRAALHDGVWEKDFTA